MKIDIQELIESLLKWLLPFYILNMIANGVLAYEVNHLTDNLHNLSGKSSLALSDKITILQGFQVIYHVIVACWLFVKSKKLKNLLLNKYIWGIFGLTKPFIGLLCFLIVILNNNMNNLTDVAAEPKQPDSR